MKTFRSFPLFFVLTGLASAQTVPTKSAPDHDEPLALEAMVVSAGPDLKSAFDLAMDRLKARDLAEGVEEAKPLSKAQKERIAQLRTEAQAKLAELEILHRKNVAGTSDPAVLAKIEIGLNAYYLNEEDGWQPDLDDIKKKITPRTRGIVLINPNNPTGSVSTRKTLEQIAELARRHNLIIFADEIYDKLIIDNDPHVAMASVAPDVPVITFGGLSKNYLAPGWRIGWGIASGEASVIKPYLEGVNKLLRARLCANHPEQYAIEPALEGPQDHLVEVKRKLRSRRDLTMKWCAETSRVSCVAPRGAFYAYPRIDIPEGDEVFVTELIRQKYVTVVHGSGFGQRPGTKHFRIVFLPDEKTLTAAYSAIGDFMRERYR